MNQERDGRTGKPMDGAELRAELERHHEASFGWALSCCRRDRAEAEEVLQAAYLKVLDGRARYDGRAAFRTWLFAVIRHTACSEHRRGWLRSLLVARHEGRQSASPELAPAPDPGDRSELRAAFQRALASLPSRQGEVLHLVFYQELSVGEAAEVMGVSVGSARQHYERGKQRLRDELKAWGDGDE